MTMHDCDAVATGLARYVEDFLPTGCHGITDLCFPRTEGAMLAVFGKPVVPEWAQEELALYETLLEGVGVEVTGRGLSETGEAWVAIVAAGYLAHSLGQLLSDLLHRRVELATRIDVPPIPQEVVENRLRVWKDWFRLRGDLVVT